VADLEHTCSAVSVRRGEPVLATASRVRRWLLVEQPGPWGRNALLESRMDPGVARALHARARRLRVRVVLVRRPGWGEDASTRRVHLAHTSTDGTWLEAIDVDDEHALLDLDLTVLGAPTPPNLGVAISHLSLVCTNGRHDQCCANLGRPVVRALHGAGVPDVWESSHVGGDRFAANVVALPSGAYLGRVPPDEAVRIVGDLARGVLDLDHYRGRSSHPTPVQAAEIAARRHLGERRLAALPLQASRVDGDEATARFGHDTGAIEVQIRRRHGEPARLTCGGSTGRPSTYDVVGIRRDPGS
jgi:hypothetical protein